MVNETRAPASASEPLKIRMYDASSGQEYWVETTCILVTSEIAVHPEILSNVVTQLSRLGKCWTVTHVPSGYRLGRATYLNFARRMAEQFASLPINWADLTRENAKDVLPAALEEMANIARAVSRMETEFAPNNAGGND